MASALTQLPVVVPDLAAVEAALGRLWQASAEAGDRAVFRAATLNLVAIVASDAEEQEVAAVLADVTAHQPGRVLILSLDPAAAADRLDAWVAAHCRLVGGGAQVCGEQVVVTAAGAAVERLAAAVPVLFVPDCPAIAWWRAGPRHAVAFLDRLLPSLDAVLVDGARFDPATLPDWVGRLQVGPESITVGDLAWERAAPWRQWLADCFDGPAPPDALRGVSMVRVEHGPGGAMVGRLFAAWLAARLGGGIDFVVRPGSGPGGLRSVALEAPRVRCEVRRETDSSVALTVWHGEAVTRRVFRHPEPDEAALVGDWLVDPRTDPAYGDALAVLSSLSLVSGRGQGEGGERPEGTP